MLENIVSLNLNFQFTIWLYCPQSGAHRTRNSLHNPKLLLSLTSVVDAAAAGCTTDCGCRLCCVTSAVWHTQLSAPESVAAAAALHHTQNSHTCNKHSAMAPYSKYQTMCKHRRAKTSNVRRLLHNRLHTHSLACGTVQRVLMMGFCVAEFMIGVYMGWTVVVVVGCCFSLAVVCGQVFAVSVCVVCVGENNACANNERLHICR